LSKVYDPHARIVLLPFYKVAPAELNQHRGNGKGGGSKNGREEGVSSSPQRAVSAHLKADCPGTILVHMGLSAAEKRAVAKKQLAEKRRIAQELADKKAKLLKKQQAKKRLLEAKRAKIKEVARKKRELKKAMAAKKQAAIEQAKLKKERLKQEALEKAALKKEKLEQEKLEKAKLEKEQKTIGQELENLSVQKLSGASSVANTLSNSFISGNSSGEGASSESSSSEGSSSEGSGENIIYVGRDEIDQYRENTELRDALAAVWHPPLGIEPDKSCSFEVAVDNNGSASRVTIEATSGILVYDSAAEAALYEMIFPERQHGKILHITFR